MLIQCPDCQTKMTPKPPAGTQAGTRISVKCRCGTVLRFRMPGTPTPSATTNPFAGYADMLDKLNMFGGKPRA